MDSTKNNKLIIALVVVGTVLLLVACCLGYYVWFQGAQAKQAAQDLLNSDSFRTVSQEQASTLQIPSLSVELPVLWEYSDEGLKTAICRYQGPMPGEDGNLVITGHDYLNGAHFGTLDKVQAGALVILYDKEGYRYDYEVYAMDTVLPSDVRSLDEYDGPHGLTLLTCSQNGNQRLLVRCKLLEAAGESTSV